jgi:hypothetical protein
MRNRSRLWALASCWLVWSLACDFSGLGQTITATPNLTPLNSSSPTGSIPPQPSPTFTITTTPFPSATLDPQATPVLIDPCNLISQDEAASAIGEPVQPGESVGGGCVYVDSSVGHYFLSIYAVPSNSAATLIEGRAFVLTTFGVLVSQSDLKNIQSLGTQGDATGVIDSLLTLTESTSTLSAQSIENVGSKAIWVSKINGAVRQSFLLAARGESLVGLDLIVTYARDESSVRDSALAVLRHMLDLLPGRFVVSVPTIRPTQTPTRTITRTPQSSPTGSALAATGSVVPSLIPSATGTPTAASGIGSQTVTVTPTLKPPAFSVPIVSSNQLTYGGSCGLSLVSVSVTVADPSQVSPITKVSLFARLNDPVSGRTTEFSEVPLQMDLNNIWFGILNAETQLPGHEKFIQAYVEYYFLATNTAGSSAESPHYGVQSNQLTLMACVTPTPAGN